MYSHGKLFIMIRCIILDDDEISRTILEDLVNKNDDLLLLDSFSSTIQAIQYIHLNDVDLVFLDIEMPGINGIELLEQFDLPNTIFVSSHPNYAIEGFNFNVIDFLEKPVGQLRFIKAIQKAKNIIDSKETNEFLTIHTGGSYYRFKYSNILYIEASGDFIKVVEKDRKTQLRHTLKSVEDRINNGQIVRSHRSYLVNLDKIKKYERGTISIENYSFPVGKKYQDYLEEKLFKN